MQPFLDFLNSLNQAIAEFATFIDPIAAGTNNLLDQALPYIGLLALIGVPINYLVDNIKKHQKKTREDAQYDQAKGIEAIVTLQGLFLFEELIAFAVFWLLPDFLTRETGWAFWAPGLRWLIVIIAVVGLAWMLSHEYSERRGLYSAIGHVAVILTGWLLDRWVGILFFSVPLLAGYYLVLYQIAMVLIPTNTYEEKSAADTENRKRFLVLVFYAWGLQFPMYVINHAWEKLTPRINGDFTMDYPSPGMIVTKSHQVAAITGGTSFKRVENPGVAFTGKLERAFQIVDLRNQFRSSKIDVVSQDGISFKAIVFTAFRMDPDSWDRVTYDSLRRKNPLLRGADKPTYTRGSFPFSQLRIRATMSITSTLSTDASAVNYWDQWALNVVEEAARKVLSQRTLDQLWRPAEDGQNKNALDNISDALKEATVPILREAGILVVVARVVNFEFPAAVNKEGEHINIEKQQIASWKADWERKRRAILDDAEAKSNRSQQDARAYAESILLKSIAEGLEKAQQVHNGLPKYIITMRFLTSLQDLIHTQPPGDVQAEKLHTYIRDWQAQFFPDGQNKRQE